VPGRAADQNRGDRTLEVAAAAADLAELVQPPGGPPRRGQQQFLDRLAGVAFGPVQLPAEAHHLGLVKPAKAREPTERLSVAPPQRCDAPLAGPTPVAAVPAGENRGAEDLPRRPQLEISAQRGGHRLIDQDGAFCYLPAEQPRVAQGQAAQGLHVAILKLAAEVNHLLADVQRCWCVAGKEHALRHAHEDQAPLAARGFPLE